MNRQAPSRASPWLELGTIPIERVVLKTDPELGALVEVEGVRLTIYRAEDEDYPAIVLEFAAETEMPLQYFFTLSNARALGAILATPHPGGAATRGGRKKWLTASPDLG